MIQRGPISRALARVWRKVVAAASAVTRGDQSRPTLPGWPSTTHDTVRFFAEPGPGFESATNDTRPEADVRVRAIAFYLPQFHAFAENDAWWGTGFTEWRNVARGQPRYRGHYQPRIPRDLGHTDLDNPETLHRQAAMARSAGIDAFCFYYYWFDGKRLMDRPLERFLSNDVDQSFCLMWANENWTRRWDGRENDVLIEQSYSIADDNAFIEDTARYMAHPRYVRVQGRPVFIIYCAQNVPDATTTIARWRKAWADSLGVEPWLLMAQTYDTRDPRPFGMDAAIEFPPHKVSKGIANRRKHRDVLDPAFKGQVRDYMDVVTQALSEPTPPWTLLRTVSPHWDNDARRQERGVSFSGSLPARYERWLEATVNRATSEPLGSDSMVFINAWNEWAEGAYLEPDIFYGHACLNATRRVLFGPQHTPRSSRLLVVGHDAHANGAQLLALSLVKQLQSRHALSVTVLLLGSGKLLDEYRAAAPTHVIDPVVHRSELETFLEREAFSMALCNTTVSGSVVPAIRQSGARVVSLIHELPEFIRSRGLISEAQSIAADSDVVVFAADTVATRFSSLIERPLVNPHILPQGLYKICQLDRHARERIRFSLGVTEGQAVVIGVGFADHRKGFDRFVEACRAWRETGEEGVFVWLGKRSGDSEKWLDEYRRRHGEVAGLHLEDFTDRVSDWLSASDVHYMSSREDPFPTATLEALSVGLPVVVHRGDTGMDELCSEHGVLVDDVDDVVAAIRHCIDTDNETQRKARREHVAHKYDHDAYVDALAALLDPARTTASVSASRQ